jgi:hypothetical protein
MQMIMRRGSQVVLNVYFKRHVPTIAFRIFLHLIFTTAPLIILSGLGLGFGLLPGLVSGFGFEIGLDDRKEKI